MHTEKTDSELIPGLRFPGTDAQHDVLTAVAPPRGEVGGLVVLRKNLFILYPKPVYPTLPDPFDLSLPSPQSLANRRVLTRPLLGVHHCDAFSTDTTDAT